MKNPKMSDTKLILKGWDATLIDRSTELLCLYDEWTIAEAMHIEWWSGKYKVILSKLK